MTVPAPISRTRSTFLVLQTAVTSAPNDLAIWTANVPTPPEAPLTRTRCPLWTRPWSRSACSAVLAATGKVAASSNETPAGFRTTPPLAAMAMYSAKEPRPPPNTSSPGSKEVTFLPVASTMPAKSVPTTTGLRPRRRCPTGERAKRSTGLADDAETRTRRPSSGTAGRSSSMTSSSPGDPGRRQTTALMVRRFAIETISSVQAERRVLVGDQREGVAVDPVDPPKYADDVVEQAARIRAREEDREPGGDDRDDSAEPEAEEHDVVRQGEDPFDQRQPAVHLPGVRVREVEVD